MIEVQGCFFFKYVIQFLDKVDYGQCQRLDEGVDNVWLKL